MPITPQRKQDSGEKNSSPVQKHFTEKPHKSKNYTAAEATLPSGNIKIISLLLFRVNVIKYSCMFLPLFSVVLIKSLSVD